MPAELQQASGQSSSEEHGLPVKVYTEQSIWPAQIFGSIFSWVNYTYFIKKIGYFNDLVNIYYRSHLLLCPVSKGCAWSLIRSVSDTALIWFCTPPPWDGGGCRGMLTSQFKPSGAFQSQKFFIGFLAFQSRSIFGFKSQDFLESFWLFNQNNFHWLFNHQNNCSGCIRF